MKYTISAALLVVTACAQPEPLCDHEAQTWDKFNTQEDQCYETRNVQIIPRGGDIDAYHRDRERGDRDHSVPDGKTDSHQRERGNPGNDKSVGRAGEKADKGMAERGNEGNRGKSN